MTDYQIAMFLFLLLPVFIFGLYKAREHRLDKKHKTAAEALIKRSVVAEKEKKMRKEGIVIELIHLESTNYRFVLFNNSGVTLRNVTIELLLKDDEVTPFSPKEIAKKFPINRFATGNSVTLKATQYTRSPSVYNVRVTWVDRNGVRLEDQIYVSV